MNFTQTVLQLFIGGEGNFRSEKDLCRLLKLNRDYEKKALSTALTDLLRSGDVVRDKNGKYLSAMRAGAMRGTVQGSDRGFAFFLPEDKSLPDLFIPARSLGGALHGDTVLARKSLSDSASSDEGEILTVLNRGYRIITGVYDGRCFVQPSDRRFPCDVFIPKGKASTARGGDRVAVELTDYPSHGNGAAGKITQVFQGENELLVEEEALIAERQIPTEFPPSALKEAEKSAAQPIEMEGRTDYTSLFTVTIDGEDTRDFDDAVSIQVTPSGYTLYVHIADVAHYVKQGGATDKEAFLRGNSVYFPDRVYPMLPECLSNGACSLNPNENRLALTCEMHFNSEGEVQNVRLCESVICSNFRLTYGEVNAMLQGESPLSPNHAEALPALKQMAELASLLSRQRDARGAIDLEVKEAKILYKEGEISISAAERGTSHRMIEEFMVAANEAVARYAERAELPFVYRVHETPSSEKLVAFSEFLKGLGISARFSEEVSPADFAQLLSRVQSTPYYPLVNKVMLRSMQKARYQTENVGHFGLASTCYSHFTSPIRRYADLAIHRVLKLALHGNRSQIEERQRDLCTEAARQASERERVADLLERDTDDLYKVSYMRRFMGETFSAVISGVTSFGIFAELPNTCEGLIRIERLPEDRYDYDADAFALIGTRHTFKLGDEISVTLVRADLTARKLDFELAGEEGGGSVTSLHLQRAKAANPLLVKPKKKSKKEEKTSSSHSHKNRTNAKKLACQKGGPKKGSSRKKR
ncbi:MAG: ribonuclease R [Clostridia bacterium]|nr:ribonuclease R [Clostridia bacterium]